MNIKKFEEYEHNFDGDITEEYAKEIISEFIDKELDDKTLAEIYYNKVINDEGIQEAEGEDIIINEMIKYLEKLLSMTKQMGTFDEIQQKLDPLRSNIKKYNL